MHRYRRFTESKASSGTSWCVVGQIAAGASNDGRAFIFRVKQDYVPSKRRDLLSQRRSVTTRTNSIFNNRKYVDHCLFSTSSWIFKRGKKKWQVGTRNSNPRIRNRLKVYFGWRKQETPREFWCRYSLYIYIYIYIPPRWLSQGC